MEARPIDILYINLDRAVERRNHIEENIRETFPPGSFVAHRISAVDGVALSARDAELPLSPFTRLTLLQPHHVTSHKQIESWGAVGCYLSHVACWQWLLAREPAVGWCLVIEDDACFPTGFYASVWQNPAIQRYVRQRQAAADPGWDVVTLGYFQGKGLERTDEAEGADMVAVHRIRPGGTFFGTQAYLVSRRGAGALRLHAFPMEVQVDAYLLVLQQLGWLRLFLIDAVQQCKGGVESSIQHWYRGEHRHHPVARHPQSAMVGALLVILVAAGVLLWSRRRAIFGPADGPKVK